MSPSHSPTLIVFRGLPGTGKTTISSALATKSGCFYLRIDSIEQALISADGGEVGAMGYKVAYALAADNLKLGYSVVADCVNPVSASRQAWQDVARRSFAQLAEIYLVCSNPAEHRRRIETRQSDIAGHQLPDWNSVIRHEFEPSGKDCPLLLDTATLSVAESIGAIENYLRKNAHPGG